MVARCKDGLCYQQALALGAPTTTSPLTTTSKRSPTPRDSTLGRLSKVEPANTPDMAQAKSVWAISYFGCHTTSDVQLAVFELARELPNVRLTDAERQRGCREWRVLPTGYRSCNVRRMRSSKLSPKQTNGLFLPLLLWMRKTVLCAKSESGSWRTTLPVQLTVQPNSFAMGSTHYYPLWLARSAPARNPRSLRSMVRNYLRRRASEGWFDRGPFATLAPLSGETKKAILAELLIFLL